MTRESAASSSERDEPLGLRASCLRAAAPAIEDAGWAANALDRFVRMRIEEAGVPPAPTADPVSLIRRASLHLTGLPPAPEEVDAFVAASDSDPERALRELVDRLLSSAAHAEVMAGWWLDLVLARRPAANELRHLQSLLDSQRSYFRDRPVVAEGWLA